MGAIYPAELYSSDDVRCSPVPVATRMLDWGRMQTNPMCPAPSSRNPRTDTSSYQVRLPLRRKRRHRGVPQPRHDGNH